MLAEGKLDDLADRFVVFAQEAGNDSPLYGMLSMAAASDPKTVEFLARCEDPRQRRPNLLFAAVHDLLLTGVDHPLADYYPSVAGSRPPDHHAPCEFAAFLREHEDAIVQRMGRRATQTNEVGRCAALWPALCQAVAPHPAKPMALIELGSSAGLLLHMDRYSYDYAGSRSGAAGSAVTIAPEVVGTPPPVVPAAAPIARRIGIDLAPLDPSSEADARWLQACTWPEHTGRRARLAAALKVAWTHRDIDLVVGELVERLPEVLRNLDPGLMQVVVHSATLAYLDESARTEVATMLDECGATRDLAVLSLEAPFLEPWKNLHDAWPQPPDAEVFLTGLTTWTAGIRSDRLLARSHPHGRWIEWLD